MLRASSSQGAETFRWGEALLSVQPAPIFDLLSSGEEPFFYIHESVLLRYVMVVFCAPAVCHCGEPGSSLIKKNLPVGIYPPTAIFSRLNRPLL